MSQNTLRYLTPNDWILIATRAKQVTFGLGEEIIAEGAPLDSLYIIRSGSAAVELNGAHSKVVLAVLERNDICGEMGFVQEGVASASVVAQADVEADNLSVQDLRQLTDTYPGLAARLYHSLASILAQRLVHTSAELMRLRHELLNHQKAK
jgi:CRP-like cAMP-binding protein